MNARRMAEALKIVSDGFALAAQAIEDDLVQEQEFSQLKSKNDLAFRVAGIAAGVGGTTVAHILGPMMARRLSVPRAAAMYVLRSRGFSLSEIGRVFNGRDHTTVISNIKGVDLALAADIETILKAELNDD